MHRDSGEREAAVPHPSSGTWSQAEQVCNTPGCEQHLTPLLLRLPKASRSSFNIYAIINSLFELATAK